MQLNKGNKYLGGLKGKDFKCYYIKKQIEHFRKQPLNSLPSGGAKSFTKFPDSGLSNTHDHVTLLELVE